MAWHSYNRYPRTLTVGERRAKAERAARKLGLKQGLDPVVIQGPLAVTWWGKAWNRNLEGYADYSNRLPRGRSYARHGSVIDLRIESGSVAALVQGSRAAPYEIKIRMDSMTPASRSVLIGACAGKLESAEALLSGRFPEDMNRLLTAEKTGLFPNPRAIHFSCSCPDWADMCKHVAATLYGVGARLDRDPSLLFLLRNIRMEDMVSQAVRKESNKLLNARSSGESARLDLAEGDLGSLFGVDMAQGGSGSQEPAKILTPPSLEKIRKAPEVRKAEPGFNRARKPAKKSREGAGKGAAKAVRGKTPAIPSKAVGRALSRLLSKVERLKEILEDLA